MSRRKSEVLAQNSHQISVHLFAFCWIRRDLDSCAFYMHDAIPLLFFFFFVLSTSSLQQMEFYCKQLLIPEEATHRHHSVWCFIPFYIFHNKKRTNTQIVCGRRWPMALRSAYVPLRYIFICHLLYGTSPWHEIYWLMCFYVCLSFWSGLPQQFARTSVERRLYLDPKQPSFSWLVQIAEISKNVLQCVGLKHTLFVYHSISLRFLSCLAGNRNSSNDNDDVLRRP